MGLIGCPTCGKMVRAQDATCWSCGHTMAGVPGAIPTAPRLSEEQRATIASHATPPRCPRCGSDALSAHRKGYGWVKGAAGIAVGGGFGALLGFVGSRKVRVTCINCGKTWTP